MLKQITSNHACENYKCLYPGWTDKTQTCFPAEIRRYVINWRLFIAHMPWWLIEILRMLSNLMSLGKLTNPPWGILKFPSAYYLPFLPSTLSTITISKKRGCLWSPTLCWTMPLPFLHIFILSIAFGSHLCVTPPAADAPKEQRKSADHKFLLEINIHIYKVSPECCILAWNYPRT